MKIMIVDDEVNIRRALRRAFRKCDYAISEAADGVEAFELLKQDSFDLLITDNNMPGKTGLELISEIKLLKPNLAIILLTGRPILLEDVPKEVMFLAKPWNEVELREKAQQIQAMQSIQ
ncbi:MAG: response regulator [Candidatus Parcubacteria bacterium]|nr:response regulator [Candidatus Parcubacteria bacterium]